MHEGAGLAAEWREAQGRRPQLVRALSLWTEILERWDAWAAPPIAPLSWSADACRQRWERGVPLLAESMPTLDAAALEPLLGPLIERLAVTGPEVHAALERFAAAWDRGEVGPSSLAPAPEKERAALHERFGLPPHVLAFLGLAGLRPALAAYFSTTRELPEGVWRVLGCAWCGGPPGWTEVVDASRRRLACHTCGGSWIAPRLRCPFCASGQSGDMVRLRAEGADDGYVLEGCRACHAYIKGVDRRQRRRVLDPLIEDWSTPHLDVYAARAGFARPTPSLSQLGPAP